MDKREKVIRKAIRTGKGGMSESYLLQRLDAERAEKKNLEVHIVELEKEVRLWTSTIAQGVKRITEMEEQLVKSKESILQEVTKEIEQAGDNALAPYYESLGDLASEDREVRGLGAGYAACWILLHKKLEKMADKQKSKRSSKKR